MEMINRYNSCMYVLGFGCVSPPIAYPRRDKVSASPSSKRPWRRMYARQNADAIAVPRIRTCILRKRISPWLRPISVNKEDQSKAGTLVNEISSSPQSSVGGLRLRRTYKGPGSWPCETMNAGQCITLFLCQLYAFAPRKRSVLVESGFMFFNSCLQIFGAPRSTPGRPYYLDCNEVWFNMTNVLH